MAEGGRGVVRQARRGRPTREQAAALDDRLRRAALEAFVANGFDGTTMEAVAEAAGTTKRTLYAKYPDKRALFAEVVPWGLARMAWDGPLDLPHGELETSLGGLARTVLSRLLDPQAVALRRLALNEARRFPEFAEAAHANTYWEGRRVLIDLLVTHAKAGEIVVDDLDLTADQFMAMVAALPTMLAEFGVFRTPEEEERHVDHAVRLFLGGVLPREDEA